VGARVLPLTTMRLDLRTRQLQHVALRRRGRLLQYRLLQ
jgi:hypothetical protein